MLNLAERIYDFLRAGAQKGRKGLAFWHHLRFSGAASQNLQKPNTKFIYKIRTTKMLTRISHEQAIALLQAPIHCRPRIFAKENGEQSSRVKYSPRSGHIRPFDAKYIVCVQDYYYYSPRDYTNQYLQRGKWDAARMQPANTPEPLQLTAYDVLSAVPHIKLYAISAHQKVQYGQLTFFAREESRQSLQDKLIKLHLQHPHIYCYETSAQLTDAVDRATIARFVFGEYTIICKL